MRLNIEHKTLYRYDEPVHYAIQALRLKPQAHSGLSIIKWQVSANNQTDLPSYIDGYGNTVLCHSLNKPHAQAEIIVRGEVETHDTQGVLSELTETLPPVFYLRSTPLTAPEGKIPELVEEARNEAEDDLGRLHAAMALVKKAVVYCTGTTHVTTTAAEALTTGMGVCQDHAHVFIAVARSLGIPARYASGYMKMYDGQEQADACHAWAEAYVENLGWIGFDPANGICPTEDYVRMACGLDYWAAAPVRGLRRGTASEGLAVSVRVRENSDQ